MPKTIGSGAKRRGLWGNSLTGLTAKEAELIRYIENDIVNEPREVLTTVDAEGNAVFAATGGAGSVNLPRNITFTDKLVGKVMSHNHPSHTGNSFSDNDISLAIRYGLKETRVITKTRDGKTVIYRMRFPENMDLSRIEDALGQGMDKNFYRFKRGAYATRDDYQSFLHEDFRTYVSNYSDGVIRERLTADVQSGRRTPAEASSIHWHLVWEKISKDFGFSYTRTILD